MLCWRGFCLPWYLARTCKDKGRLFNAPKDKANILNRQYQATFTQEDTNQVPSPSGTPYPDMEEIEVDETSIRKLLQKTCPRKATGPDCIPARILKDCASELAPILTRIFNKSLQEGRVPEDWQHENVTAIFKKGTRHDAANYRPVSLTSLCCKLLEHVIVYKNSKWVWSGNTTITNRRQPHGTTRKSRSTITRHQEDKSKATSSLFPIKTRWLQYYNGHKVT